MPTAITSRKHPATRRGHAATHRAHSVPHPTPDKEADEDAEGLELPVRPDEGTPLIPDEDGEIQVPG
jgi:hypothetical protein